MFASRQLHVIYLSCIFIAASIGAHAEECDADLLENSDSEVGHALLATRVVQTKIAGIPAELVESEISEQQRAAIDELRSIVSTQGHATAQQLQNLFDLTPTAAASKAKIGDTIHVSSLLDAKANASTKAEQPFKGDNDPIAARDAFEKDFIKDGPGNESALTDDDEPMLFPKKSKKGVNSTLDYNTKDDVNVEQKHQLAEFVVGPVAAVIFAVFTISNIMEKFDINAIPESGIVISFGMGLGTLMKLLAHFDFFDDADAFGEMNSAILNLILLPIIIFASGWCVRRQDFYSQFPYILMFAIVGVALSTVVIACLIWGSGAMAFHNIKSWRTAFAYASLISATDPVATLTTYGKLKVDPLLNIMVFGESIINDAVAIVLFNVFNADEFMVDHRTKEAVTGGALFSNICFGVVKNFFGSALLGVALGMIYTLIAHWADMKHNKKGQILNIFASCYLTYAAAEAGGMSGIIATMFAALLMGVYMRPHLSQEGSLLATFFVKQLATLADAAVCLLIGVSVVQLTTKGWQFGLWTMLFCLIGRACAIFPVGWFCNRTKAMVGRASNIPEDGWNLLKPQDLFMMWHAGLRGAIALALSLELGHWVDQIDGPGTRRTLQTACFLLIVTFLLLFGGTTQICLSKLGIQRAGEDWDFPIDHLSKNEDKGMMALRNFMKWMDQKVLTPMLIGDKLDFIGEEEKDVEVFLKSSNVHKYAA